MRKFCMFTLLSLLLLSTIGYAVSAEPPPQVSSISQEVPPSVDDTPSLPLGSSDIVTEVEPFPDDSALLADDVPPADIQPDTADSLQMVHEQLTDIVLYFQLICYIFVPFSFALFICWQIGKMFYVFLVR